MRHLGRAAVVVALAATLTLARPQRRAVALDEMTAEERDYAAWIAAGRRGYGAPALVLDGHLTAQAQLQASRNAAAGQLDHSPRGELAWWLTRGWREVVAENVAVGANPWEAHLAVVASPPHLANMLDARHCGYGVAVRRDAYGRTFTAEVYAGLGNDCPRP